MSAYINCPSCNFPDPSLDMDTLTCSECDFEPLERIAELEQSLDRWRKGFNNMTIDKALADKAELEQQLADKQEWNKLQYNLGRREQRLIDSEIVLKYPMDALTADAVRGIAKAIREEK